MVFLRERILPFVLTAVLFVSLLPVFALAEEDTSDSQETEIVKTNEEGDRVLPTLRSGHFRYFYGFPDRTFRPKKDLTRAQTAQLVFRLLQDPVPGDRPCSYQDVSDDAWYAEPVRTLCTMGILDDDLRFRPDALISRAEFVRILTRLHPLVTGDLAFSDVPEDHVDAQAIGAAAALGWIKGYPDGTFRPEDSLTRAEACTALNRMMNRKGDSERADALLALGLFTDIKPGNWAAAAVVEASVNHSESMEDGEVWNWADFEKLTFDPGVHEYDGVLYYADRYGKLATNTEVGAYTADSLGQLTQTTAVYQMPWVPYYSQIDGIYAWVGCESVAAFMGLQAKGFAMDVDLNDFVNGQPRSNSDPEKGFVGSPYVPDPSKRTRTTIYPAKLAEYCNSYCGGDVVCTDFRGATIEQLRREVLAGNCVVGYMTLWWNTPFYRNYNIEGSIQSLVSNNHAVLVCGYDPDRGYLVSDPYNYYNRGKVHQYWENAYTFESIWNHRQVGMLLR